MAFSRLVSSLVDASIGAKAPNASDVSRRASVCSAPEIPSDRFGRDADRGDRFEKLAMRDAEMLAPPAHLPVLGEIDRELGRRSARPRVTAALALGLRGRPHERRSPSRAGDAARIRA
jgi:hypothetical protein